MSVYDKISTALRERDLDGFLSQLAEDFQFVSHQDGTVKDKQAFAEMIGQFMASDSLGIHDQRCVYENDDIMVSHTVIDFPDGTREAVLTAHLLSGGKVIRTETGATPIAT